MCQRHRNALGIIESICCFSPIQNSKTRQFFVGLHNVFEVDNISCRSCLTAISSYYRHTLLLRFKPDLFQGNDLILV